MSLYSGKQKFQPQTRGQAIGYLACLFQVTALGLATTSSTFCLGKHLSGMLNSWLLNGAKTLGLLPVTATFDMLLKEEKKNKGI
jgi:hypothetical protein